METTKHQAEQCCETLRNAMECAEFVNKSSIGKSYCRGGVNSHGQCGFVVDEPLGDSCKKYRCVGGLDASCEMSDVLRAF